MSTVYVERELQGVQGKPCPARTARLVALTVRTPMLYYLFFPPMAMAGAAIAIFCL